MTRDQLRHLEHGDALLAVEHDLQRVIRIDLRPFVRVLQVVLLDVIPELFDHLTTGDGLGADDFGECFIGLDGLHQSRIDFARGGFLGRRHGVIV